MRGSGGHVSARYWATSSEGSARRHLPSGTVLEQLLCGALSRDEDDCRRRRLLRIERAAAHTTLSEGRLLQLVVLQGGWLRAREGLLRTAADALGADDVREHSDSRATAHVRGERAARLGSSRHRPAHSPWRWATRRERRGRRVPRPAAASIPHDGVGRHAGGCSSADATTPLARLHATVPWLVGGGTAADDWDPSEEASSGFSRGDRGPYACRAAAGAAGERVHQHLRG